MNFRGLLANQGIKTWRDRWEDAGGFANIPERTYQAKAQGDTAEILIYEQIGVDFWDGSGVSAKQFAEDLKALGDVKTINLRINSPGGVVYEADAIYTSLNRHPAKKNVYIDGLAASAASYIAMVGDTIQIAEHAKLMIHNAWGITIGNADDMRKQADVLDQLDKSIRVIYQRRTGQSDAKLKDMMSAETWMVGSEAVENKFADSVVKAKTAPKDQVADFQEVMRMRLQMARAK